MQGGLHEDRLAAGQEGGHFVTVFGQITLSAAALSKSNNAVSALYPWQRKRLALSCDTPRLLNDDLRLARQMLVCSVEPIRGR